MGKAAAKRAAARGTRAPARPTRPIPAQGHSADPTGWEQPRARVLVDALEELGELRGHRAELANREIVLVDALRRAGAPWRMIGEALGTSAQAAQQRFAILALGRQ